jgi:single-strand DNA-binding protein
MFNLLHLLFIIYLNVIIMKQLRNSVRLIGRLGFDPEVRELESGRKFARLSVATNDFYKDSDGNKVEETQWHNVIAWGKLAEICHERLKKGFEIALEGKLTSRQYTDNNGVKRGITEVLLDKMEIIQRPATALEEKV